MSMPPRIAPGASGQVPGASPSGAARHRRDQKQRALARHVNWLWGLKQASASHHTCAPAACPDCSALLLRVEALEQLIAGTPSAADGGHAAAAVPAPSAVASVAASHKEDLVEVEPWLVDIPEDELLAQVRDPEHEQSVNWVTAALASAADHADSCPGLEHEHSADPALGEDLEPWLHDHAFGHHPDSGHESESDSAGVESESESDCESQEVVPPALALPGPSNPGAPA